MSSVGFTLNPRTYLRLEGFGFAAVALSMYIHLNGSVWLLIVLAFAPDLSMLGYLAGPKIGSLTYNSVHTYLLPLGLGSVGLLWAGEFVVLVSLIWIGHIGFDRLLGYGLKYDTGFKATHLTKQPNPIAAFRNDSSR